MSREIRIVLGEAAFRALVRGGEVTVVDAGVKIILRDIGFSEMADAVKDARLGTDHYVPARVNSDGDGVP